MLGLFCLTAPSQVTQVIETPSLEAAPSNKAVIGRYLLDPVIFTHLENLKPGSGGEIQLTDAINYLAQSGCVETLSLVGKRYDCGSVRGYTNAIMRVSDRRKR